MWDRLFYDYNIKLEKGDLEMIQSSRNKVMHNKDFSYDEFKTTKKLLKKLTKALEKEIININEVKYKENANVSAVYTSLRDAFSTAIETSEIFGKLSENFKNMNLGLKEVFLSENQKELIRLRKYQEEIIKQHNKIAKDIINNFTSNNKFDLIFPESNIRKTIGNLGNTSEILKDFKLKLNIPPSHINDIIKNLENCPEELKSKVDDE